MGSLASIAVVALAMLVFAACSGQPAKTASAASTAAAAAPAASAPSSAGPAPATSSAAPSASQNVPAYQPSTGFAPDAVRILTVTSIRIALEEYRAAKGAYPTSLAALFPGFAPRGENGALMASPPPASEGYTYTRSSATTYTLSVPLSTGEIYRVSAPTSP